MTVKLLDRESSVVEDGDQRAGRFGLGVAGRQF
jgi:hypothetical protein